MKTYFTLIVFLVFTVTSFSQSNLKIGEWKAYLPFHTGLTVTQSDNSVIYGTENSLVIINKEDLSPTFITKVEGLSDHEIRLVKYDKYNKQLIVSYDNGNIDVIKDDEIINIPFVKFNNQSNDKRINDIHISNENFAYLSYAFGIIQLDLKKLDFKTTCFTNLIVNGTSSDESNIYAATEEGVFTINQSNPAFGNFLEWTFISGESGLPAVYTAEDIAVYNNQLFVNISGVVWKREGGLFSKMIDETNDAYRVEFLTAEGERLVVGMKNNQFNSRINIYDISLNKQTISSFCVNRVLYGIEDQNGDLWYADEWRGFRYTKDGCQKVEFNSPFEVKATDIQSKNGLVYIASGGATDEFGYLQSNSGFYILENNVWENIRGESYQPIKDNDFANIQVIAPHPKENKLMIGSFYSGLMEYDLDTKESVFYDQFNSSLEGTIGDQPRERISGLAYDDDGNLWMTNHLSPNPLKVMTPEGAWYTFSIPGTNLLTSITIDKSGNKWMTSLANGVIVFNENGTLADPTDDEVRVITESNSELSSNGTNSVAIDLDGEVWVGTEQGPVIFECGSSVFDVQNCQGTRRKVLQDSIAAFLLETEDIRCIEIDGANRKWFGTRNGIFVQSADGETQEYNFNIDNSPLFDNKIKTMHFIPLSGEMFISSEGGIQSIRTNSTSGGSTFNPQNIYAFPNPVRPDYAGPIAIKGLARNANVKITDLSGKLVAEMIANGGQAIWSGEDYTGRRVATGVYLVFCSNTPAFENPETYVTKIMVVN